MNQDDHKKLNFIICFFILTAFLFLYRFEAFVPGVPFSVGEAKTYDLRAFYGKKISQDPRLVFLSVDKPNYTDQYPDRENLSKGTKLLLGPWPWSREVWALAIDRLVGAGAKVVALDLIFKTEGLGDQELQKILLKHSKQVVLGLNIQLESMNSVMQSSLNEQSLSFDYPSRSIVGNPDEPRFKSVWDSIAFVNFIPDPVDNTIRYVNYFTQGSLGQTIPSFSAKILEKMEDKVTPDQLPELALFRLTYNPQRQSEFDSYHDDVFLPTPFFQIFDEKIWERNFQSGAFFKDKVVVIGVLGD
ncbi:MAG: CHASE2 domain-containing protein, partial [Verrucomicrobiota bacterium]